MTYEPARVYSASYGFDVDAELLERFLRQRRSRLAEADDVAVVEALHLDAVHVDVEEPQVRRRAARRQRSARLRRVRLDARRDRGEVHDAALIQRQILDLLLHHWRGHREPLYLHLFHALARDRLRGELGGTLRKVNSSRARWPITSCTVSLSGL